MQIIPFPTDEKTPDEEFQPKEKYGILVVGKNIYTGFAIQTPDFPRWYPFVSGNLNIYDWELLMTGTVDFGKKSPLNALDSIAGIHEGEEGIARISRTVPEEAVRATFAHELECYEGGKNSNGGYREVAKVWPGTDEVLPEFEKAVERFSSLGDDDTLTAIIIFSHGENGSIEMGDSHMEYRKMLKDLDKINGKKSVFVYACNSGSFLKALRIHPRRRDYAAITSCEAENLSTNWNDRGLDNYLFKHFSERRRYSDLKLKPINEADHDQHPQMLRYFDARLI